MQWDELAEMHLLLREHGWEAEYVDAWRFDDGTLGEHAYWVWKRPSSPKQSILTSRDGIAGRGHPGWRSNDYPPERVSVEDSRSPATLEKRLKELAK